MKKRIVAKAQKRHKRNRQKARAAKYLRQEKMLTMIENGEKGVGRKKAKFEKQILPCNREIK